MIVFEMPSLLEPVTLPWSCPSVIANVCNELFDPGPDRARRIPITLESLIIVPVLCKKTLQNLLRYALFLRYYCQ